MPELETLPQDTQQELEKLGTIDVVAGVPTYNNTDTIADVVRAVQAGLQQYFPSFRSVVINADGGSKDGTPERALQAAGDGGGLLSVAYPMYPVHKLSTPYHGVPGRSSALRSIFLLARRLNARACVLVDASQTGLNSQCIDALARPVLERDFDFVAPYFLRHKFDGALINGIVYPMVRALYGKRVRQPIGDDFAFSGKLMDYLLEQDAWHQEVAQFGVDIWMSTQTICAGFKICQSFLGPKTRNPKEPAVDLSAMLSQVLGPLFGEVERDVSKWQKVRGSEAVPTFGPRFEFTTETVPVNVKRMVESFQLGYQDLQEIWSLVLPPAALLELKRLAGRSEQDFRFEDDVWARIVYDFALGYRMRVIGRDHLLRALTPLYVGWAASLVLQLCEAASTEIEARLERLCAAFERQKPYLISRWRWPDRFNP